MTVLKARYLSDSDSRLQLTHYHLTTDQVHSHCSLELGSVSFSTSLLKFKRNWWKIVAAGCEPTLACNSKKRERIYKSSAETQNAGREG